MADDIVGAAAIQQTGDTISQSIDGLHQTVANTEEKLDEYLTLFGKDGWFYNSFNKVCKSMGLTVNEKKPNEKTHDKEEESDPLASFAAGADKFSSMFGGDKAADVTGAPKKKTKTSGLKTDDLQELDETNGLGFAVISLQIAEIAGILKKKDGGKGGGGGLSGFFKGLMEGVGAIAALGAALLCFAGATMLFQFVDWGSALIGLLAFTTFTIGMLVLAKLLGTHARSFKKMAQGAMLMSLALVVFSVSLYISSLIIGGTEGEILGLKIPPINIGAAFAALGMFTLFIVIFAALAIAVAYFGAGPVLMLFAGASLMMAVSLVTFSIALLVSSKIVSGEETEIMGLKIPAMNIGAAFAALGFFMGFMTLVTVLCALAAPAIPLLAVFGAAAILLSVALVTFSLSLVITSQIFSPEGLDGHVIVKENVYAGLAMMGEFLLACVGVGVIALLALVPAAAMLATSVILFPAILLLSLSMGMVCLFFTGGEASDGEGNKSSLPKISMELLTPGLEIMKYFMQEMLVLGALAIPVTVTSVFLLAASALIFASVLFISLSLGLICLIGGGKKEKRTVKNPDGTESEVEVEARKENIDGFVGTTKYMFTQFAKLGPIALLATVAGIFILPASTLIFTSVLFLSMSFGLISLVMKGGKKKVTDTDGKDNDVDTAPYENSVVKDFFGAITDLIKSFADIPFFKLLGVAGKAAMLLPFATCLNTISLAMLHVIEFYEKSEKFNEIDVGLLFDPFLKVIDSLVDTANNLKTESQESYQLVIESIGPITDALMNLIYIVEDAAVFDEKPELIDAANRSLERIMFGSESAPGFMQTFNRVCRDVEGASEDAALAMQSMPAITDALGNLVYIVKDASELTGVELGIQNTRAISHLLEEIILMFCRLTPGGLINGIGDFFGGSPADAIENGLELLQGDKGLVAAVQALEPLGRAYESLSVSNKPFDRVITDNLVHAISSFFNVAEKAELAGKAVRDFAISVHSASMVPLASQELINLGSSLALLNGIAASNDPFRKMSESVRQLRLGITNLTDEMDKSLNKMKEVIEQAQSAQKKLEDSAEKASAGVNAGKASRDAASYTSISDLASILLNWDDDGYVKVRTAKEQKAAEREEKFKSAFGSSLSF